MLEACPISDALMTWIPADEEPPFGNAAVYAVIIISSSSGSGGSSIMLCISLALLHIPPLDGRMCNSMHKKHSFIY